MAKSGKIASAIEKIKANPLKTLVFEPGLDYCQTCSAVPMAEAITVVA